MSDCNIATIEKDGNFFSSNEPTMELARRNYDVCFNINYTFGLA